MAAEKAWEGKLKLDILDHSDQVGMGAHGRQTNPSITVSASGKEHASYAFVTHHPGYASIQEGTGPNRGNKAYEFKVDNMEDLTEAQIDEVLRVIVQIATGLKSR